MMSHHLQVIAATGGGGCKYLCRGASILRQATLLTEKHDTGAPVCPAVAFGLLLQSISCETLPKALSGDFGHIGSQ